MADAKARKTEAQKALRQKRKSALREALAGRLEPHGFQEVRKDHFGHRVLPRELLFERVRPDVVEHIALSHHKYDAPLYQIHLLIKSAAPDTNEQLINSYSLVRNGAKQYYYFWGARWYIPWKEAAWQRSIQEVESLAQQMLEFFEGRHGPNISRNIYS